MPIAWQLRLSPNARVLQSYSTASEHDELVNVAVTYLLGLPCESESTQISHVRTLPVTTVDRLG